MLGNKVFQSVKYLKQSPKKGMTNEFIAFVGKQFKQLTSKNLQIPIKLFHL